MSARTKEYPLRVEDLRDVNNGDILTVFSRGHHNKSEFARAVVKEHEIDLDPTTIRHTFARRGFNGEDVIYGNCWTLYEATAPGRGIFPVTIADV